MVSEFGVPFVYDNHENWSEYSKILTDTNNRNASETWNQDQPRKILRHAFKENSKRLYYKIMEKVGK